MGEYAGKKLPVALLAQRGLFSFSGEVGIFGLRRVGKILVL